MCILENGCYCVWLNINGEWKPYVLDDWIPVVSGKPAFSQAKGPELWVLLLEKAYAKAYKSYLNLEGGDPATALRDLTGAPTESIEFEDKTDKEIFKFLLTAEKNKWILTCYTGMGAVREE